MYLYELITPSDPITFKAKNNKIAFICAVLLGNGQAGVNKYNSDDNIPSLLFLSKNPNEIINSYLDNTVDNFIENNKNDIKECFKSFAYGNFNSRIDYDNAIEAITDSKKLEEFKKKHEDKNRSSMSQWVKLAWDMGDRIK